MRVLWFTGVQLPALTGQGLTRAGWQESLRKALETYSPQIELGIAAFGPSSREPVIKGNSIYYTLPRIPPHGKWARFRKAWQHTSYTQDEFNRSLAMVMEYKPDLVHFHGSENFYGLMAEKLPVPSILSVQAVINGLYPFLFVDQEYKEVLKQLATLDFVKGNGQIHRWMTLNKYRVIERRILQECKNFMGRTDWDRGQVMAYNPLAHYYHCDEAMADEYYSSMWDPDTTSEENIIFSTCSNALFKGGLTLVNSVVVLKQRGWNNIRLHLAGVDSNSEVGKRIVKVIKEQSLERNIFMLGRLDPQQIIDEMLKARVFILPSHMDNSPNSLCEALLMGMPCIASHVGGIPSLINEGVNGVLYHDRDPYMLAEKIIQVLSDRQMAVALGARARQSALVRHDRKRIAERTLEIYQMVGQA